MVFEEYGQSGAVLTDLRVQQDFDQNVGDFQLHDGQLGGELDALVAAEIEVLFEVLGQIAEEHGHAVGVQHAVGRSLGLRLLDADQNVQPALN